MAGDDWRATTLGEVIELKRGYDLPKRDRRPGPYPVVSSSGISGSHVEAKVEAPGVVTGRYGTIGQVFHIVEDFWPLNTALYVRDFKGNDVRFISYLLQTLDFSAYSDKAAVPGVNRNHLHMASVCVPGIMEQQAIAYILGALDDKIELNRRMNETLEETAQAIFKSWFVDFDPVRAKADGEEPPGLAPHIADLFTDAFEESDLGEIPTGWRVKPLDRIAKYQNGLALQRYPPEGDEYLPVIKIRELRQGSSDNKSGKASPDIREDCIIEDGDIIFSWSGSLLVDIWCGGRGALNQHLFKVTSAEYPRWFYYHWTRHHLAEFQRIAAGKATTMGHIKRNHLSEALVAVPPDEVLRGAGATIAPLIQLIVNNDLQSRTLVELRDSLLLKLISGEIRVPEAERLMEETL